MWDTAYGSNVPFAFWGRQSVNTQLAFTEFTSEVTIRWGRAIASFDSSILIAFISFAVIIRAIALIPVIWDLPWFVVSVPTVARKFLPPYVKSKLKITFWANTKKN